MGFGEQYQKESGSNTTNKSNNEIGVNIVVDDGVFQGSGDESQVKQQLSDLENIIMEGDIILNIHADGENMDVSQRDFESGECAEHSSLYLHQDEMLVKVGDRFESNKDFVKYVNDNAKRWNFYYKCTESQNVDTDVEAYTYSCLYLRNRDYKKKGIKKRFNCKTDCPCKVKLRRRPGQDLTVVYVCNHHDHELSRENFNKLQHNRKLPPYIKEIIMDLLALEVEIVKIRKFVEMETGVKMSRAFFYEIERKMKLKNEERHITDKRLKELSDKMCVVDEMYSGDEDDTDDQQNTKTKRPRLSSGGFASKLEGIEKQLEESMNDTQESSWIDDQSGTQRTSTSEWDNTSMAPEAVKVEHETFQDTGHDTMTDEYGNEYTIQEETPPTETTQQNSFPQYETVVLQDEFGNIINDENIVILQQDENGLMQGENGAIGYFDGEQIIYVPDPNQVQDEQPQNEQHDQQNETADNGEPSNACDAAVQTNRAKAGHSYVPVFDVYMKNGNVTGFLVNDNLVKGAADKSTSEHQESSQISESLKDSVCDMNALNGLQEYVCGDTYTKNEYIHRYNIDTYMTNQRFPKYIDTLAKKTRTDVLHMLTRVYNEKAMFKMTTTQKGKEGNTKIWYLTDVRRKGKYKMSDEEKMKKDKLGQYITDILILKERVKLLKKENEELVTRNKYLEELALRLAKMNESN